MITNTVIVALLLQAGISFSLVHDSLVVVPVFVNGHGPYRFLLDTGATHSIVSRSLADELGIPILEVRTLITAGGTLPVTVRNVEIVQIGDVRIPQAHITVSDAGLLKELRLDGIIGADYLKDYRISIDYAHKLLTIQH